MSYNNYYTYLVNFQTPCGSTVYAQVFNGSFDGDAEEVFPDGSKIEFEFSNGVRKGEASYYLPEERDPKVFWYNGGMEESPLVPNIALFGEFVLQNTPATPPPLPPHPSAIAESSVVPFHSRIEKSPHRKLSTKFTSPKMMRSTNPYYS